MFNLLFHSSAVVSILKAPPFFWPKASCVYQHVQLVGGLVNTRIEVNICIVLQQPSLFRFVAHQMQLTERGGPPISFNLQYSPTFDCIATNRNWQKEKGKGPSKLQTSTFFNPLIASLPMQLTGEGPLLTSSIDIQRPFDSLITKQIDTKGRAPGQLQSLIFSNLWLHRH